MSRALSFLMAAKRPRGQFRNNRFSQNSGAFGQFLHLLSFGSLVFFLAFEGRSPLILASLEINGLPSFVRQATFLCAEHAQQLGGASPLSSLMVVKD